MYVRTSACTQRHTLQMYAYVHLIFLHNFTNFFKVLDINTKSCSLSGLCAFGAQFVVTQLELIHGKGVWPGALKHWNYIHTYCSAGHLFGIHKLYMPYHSSESLWSHPLPRGNSRHYRSKEWHVAPTAITCAEAIIQ